MNSINKPSNLFYLLMLATVLFLSPSCKKYLDEKTDKKLVVPSTLQDAATLMDSYGLLNSFYPALGILSDDDFYFTTSSFNTEGILSQSNYTWAKDVYNENEWGYLYQMLLFANISLETLEKVELNNLNAAEWNRVKGTALFFRANTFYNVTQYYAQPYVKATASQQLGIPLRLDSDPNKVSVRSSLQQSYDRIIADLSEAVQLLPVTNIVFSRPTKAAAFGELARVYLNMGEYALAKQNADSSLSYSSNLLDYNSINSIPAYPFAMWNAEEIFPSTMFVYFGNQNMLVDSFLYRSYDNNDLRKSLFFKVSSGGAYSFRGSYEGTSNPFGGLTVAELLLIHAEANARLGNKTAALADLNSLLIKRYKTGTLVPVTAGDAAEALVKILTERRKELLSRGQRWSDLRRLNLEPQFAKTLIRVVNGQTYTLPPNDPRYTHYIPAQVISISGMQQNPR